MQQTSQNVISDSPPPYDTVPNSHGSKPKVTPVEEAVIGHEMRHTPVMIVGPSYVPQQHPSFSPTVYHYVNPNTGEHITSLLPPDHPEMICLQQGQHVTETKFGLIGVLAAIFWFPLGIGLCLLDRRVKCTRCGATTREGMCGAI